YGGNHVVVQVADDACAFYGHLMLGSLAVEVGESVAVGQVLGLLGNTGNSTAPHLHFALLDGPDPLANNSMPWVFEGYTLLGDLDSGARGDFLAPGGSVSAIVGTPNEQRSTLPLNWTVTDFG
ncbi:MAG TPA: M23 family metallopeptidase, partial [Thermomicrobiales bacterium]|nr:M23 family metallopeptidase [Thermomicrobiales bacterium]